MLIYLSGISLNERRIIVAFSYTILFFRAVSSFHIE